MQDSPKFYSIDTCRRSEDHRGSLIEFLRRDDLHDQDVAFGQIYFVTFDRPNQVRGNHYHLNGYESFGAVHGTLKVALEDLDTGQHAEFVLNSDDHLYRRLTIGPRVVHAFLNLSPTAILLNYCTEQYNSDDPDRYEHVLI